MAHTGVTVLILCLGLAISTVFASNGTDPLCSILSTAGNSTTAFNLTVSPDTLSDNTNYIVHLEGSGNVTVILQALSTSGPVGNWSNGNISCDGSPLFLNPFENGSQIQAQWKSSNNVTSVNITAHIHNENSTFIVSRTLSHVGVSPTTNITTATTSSNNVNATSTTTATTPAKTTSAGSALQTSLLTVAFIQILGLFTITNKYLS
ncbi:uncharacterized protein [Pyxicephalus adspersus]|uniref:uncharacterized protein n=1 Tax=Pyxicephalus adspersus TaxID=30357 RepID=UPI003B5B0ECD